MLLFFFFVILVKVFGHVIYFVFWGISAYILLVNFYMQIRITAMLKYGLLAYMCMEVKHSFHKT